MLNKIKIDQIAIATKDATKLKELFKLFGLSDWKEDNVLAKGTVRGVDGENKALLNFNYSMGIEFEILEYQEGLCWHDELRQTIFGKDNFISHLGAHTDEETLQEAIQFMASQGIEIAQEVYTISHTNEYLVNNKRKYHYVIFNSYKVFGFDLKLIVRR